MPDAAQSDTRFSARFWGVRGSISCPGPDHARYGGHTSCVEVRCGGHLFIFDGGSGLRVLGESLMAQGGLVEADVLLTHSHIDHIIGIPFFRPFFDSLNRFSLYAGHLKPEKGGLRGALGDFMQAPLFPVPPGIFDATIDYKDFVPGATLRPRDGVVIHTAPLNHPNGATGYRVEFAGKSLCYVTDTEHVPGEPDARIIELIRGADVVIYDATYTDDEFAKYVGYGHSTWQEGVRLAEAADVGRLVIFHHDPNHVDTFMDAVAEEAAAIRPGTVVAREGMTLRL
ncbi:MAG: phosphoribosyl 1,2-cyclic phosphodiesterase [Myxococcota bacterium]|jgi:phosphoribosyl 1,2-cyclic phosphodiesterase